MIRRTAALLLCMALFLLCALPAAADAETAQKVVRVGWYETPFNRKDAFGRRTGYAYEYQRKIAAYTGWKYEYVEGSWPELLQMLQDGRIDLMSDVSYTKERAEQILYAGIPMGEEMYFLYVAPGSGSVSIEDPASLNGRTVGVTQDSMQKEIFLSWAEVHGLQVNLLETECSEAESLALLAKGKMDAFVTLDTYADPELAVPLWKIGSSDFFFAVTRGRPDLLAELDTAMSRIQDENKYYSQQLAEKYLQSPGTNRYLTAEENAWLAAHGKIRVGFQDNYLAFCAADAKTGELTGALKDYLASASGALENARPEFEAVVYPTAAAAIEAVTRGEVDCMFPANLTDYDGEVAGVVMTAPMMRTEMDAVVRAEDQQDLLRKGQVHVAVNQGNPNYEMFLLEHFPGWTPVYYDNTSACLDAVAAKNADCIIISNYRYGELAAQCERLGLSTVYTGVEMDYRLAVKEGNTSLYSILSKIICQIPESTVSAALIYYSAPPAKSGFADFFRTYPAAVISMGILALALMAALLRSAFLRKKKEPGKK